jgi:two-component system response regulator DctR
MIYIVDDDDALRDALAWLLKSRGIGCLGFESAERFLQFARLAGPAAQQPGCVLLDIRMPGMSGEELFSRLGGERLCGAWPVIFLTGHGMVPMAVEALKGGAFDFVEKPSSDNTLVSRLEAALAESARRIEQLASAAALKARLASLTPREREVMELMLLGLYNKVIGDRLGISMRTVEVFRAKVFEKFGVKTAVELASLLAMRRQEA